MIDNPIGRAARTVFEGYAHLDGDQLPGDELPTLQVQLARWQVANFGTQPDDRFVRGIIEELGELEDAHGSEDDSFDAVGDVLVYTMQLCTAFRLDFGSIWTMRDSGALVDKLRDGTLSAVVAAIGRIAHVSLKRSQGIRGFSDDEFARSSMTWALATFLRHFSMLSLGYGVKPIEALRKTAELVMQRDWKKSARNGAV